MEFTKVEYPDMRMNLIAYAESLSDLKYQRQYWGKTDPENPNFYDDFDASVNFLDDMIERDNDSKSWIGLVLKNHNEAVLFDALNKSIENLLQEHGYDLTDEHYMVTEEWRSVLDSAKNLHSELVLVNTD
ncbi:SCO4402 family protein [Psychrobacter celer]|uniref:SCO4402 family protein n=1 Tax=Psychrobacter celer TaxID=306572 RepID=UPI003FCFF6F0